MVEPTPVELPNVCSVRSQYDVIVIGAGVAGSLSALLAARRGMEVLLVDRQRFPRPKVCGCCLNNRAQQVLKRYGLESGLRRLCPVPTNSMRLHFEHRSLQIPMPGGLAVSRSLLDQWLVDEAVEAGAQFEDDVNATVIPLASDTTAAVPETQSARDPSAAALRTVELKGSRLTATADAAVVLVCDGLGHASLHRMPGFESIPRKGARLGLGATFPRGDGDHWIPEHQIQMAIAKHGYVGLVEVENGLINLAAAVDAARLQESKSPLKCLTAIFESAGVSVPELLPSASLRGTVPLTRTSSRLCAARLLVLGDATGYVEPFTGEGMAWALSAAMLAEPIVAAAVSHRWTTSLEHQFLSKFRNAIVEEQKLCRFLAKVLGNSTLLKLTFTGFRMFPSAARRLVDRVNRLPSSLELTE
jgi:flavin-dependent dehydrogenase